MTLDDAADRYRAAETAHDEAPAANDTGGIWEGLSPPYATIVADPPWDYGGTFTPKPPGEGQA